MNEPLNLNIGLGDVDTSMPRLASGKHLMGIKKAEVGPNKAGTGHNLLVSFATKEPAESTAGDVLNPGFQVRKYYPLQQSDKENAPDFRRDIAVLIDAAYNVDDANNRPTLSQETIAGLVGREVVVTVKVTQSDEYGEQNEVGMISAVG